MKVGKAVELAKKLLINNNLRNWKVVVTSDKENPGICDYSTKTIGISGLYVPHCTDEGVYNLIVHEVAHALCPGQNHNIVWRRKCLALGGNGKIEFDLESLTDVTLLAEIL